MNYLNNKLTLIVFLILIISAANFFLVKYTTPKIAYVKISELYNSFQMKKELEADYLQIENKRKSIIDSITVQFNSIYQSQNKTESDKQRIRFLYDDLMKKKTEFEEDNARLKSELNERIFKQINQYVQDYSLENSCDFVLGADGSGSIMASNVKYDITNEVSLYINKKYEGK